MKIYSTLILLVPILILTPFKQSSFKVYSEISIIQVVTQSSPNDTLDGTDKKNNVETADMPNGSSTQNTNPDPRIEDEASQKESKTFFQNLTLGEVLAIIIGFVSTVILFITWRTNIFLKSQEILLIYHKRYTELLDSAKNVKDEDEAKNFYRNFWSLNHEEFSFWRRGLLPKETYRYWLNRRQKEKDSNPFSKDCLSSYQEGWNTFATDIVKSDYHAFFEKIMKDDDIDILMKKHGPNLFCRNFPFIFTAREIK